MRRIEDLKRFDGSFEQLVGIMREASGWDERKTEDLLTRKAVTEFVNFHVEMAAEKERETKRLRGRTLKFKNGTILGNMDVEIADSRRKMPDTAPPTSIINNLAKIQQMGTHFLLRQLSSPAKATPPSLPLLNHNSHHLSTSNHASRPSGPRLAWKNRGPTSTGPSRFNFEDELYTDSDDHDDEFGFSGTGKQRVIKAFGWMIPAVAVSFLLGTDNPNAFLMALAVPLGQTALSLVLDKVWGTTSTNPKRRSRTKTRKKPFARASSKTKKTEPRAGEHKTNEGKGSYQSWVATDGGSTKKNTSRAPSFGGWDDLDKASYKASGRRSQKGDERPKQNEGKLSRRRRVRDRPLLLRLLIAVFPFLDSWSKFLS
ncbi:hypothetical protein SADUNF_Sadunf19G0032800 [Salix dunnii]|uniref:Uncharacterized protein n=1 Tax=Salix dunnii TaxID=1413687 RepID=A0A835MCA2_9ROSI|nr:hypothetical protein SADUNF_Sadunf19G0032800 [Salix dunnii]